MKNIKSLIIALIVLTSSTQIKAQAVTTSTAVNNVVTAYYGVKNALTADNNNLAQASAKALLAAITAVPMDKFTADQHNLWMSYSTKLQFDGRHIRESSALDHQREYFTSLSKNLYELVKGLKMNTAVIYEQYCPMKKATWLSETSEIKNPYYGKQMLTCGKVTETLSPATK
ncbi:DUF3347 domain-containing protein [Mucilaginibacter sp.]|uniref:DUF3347 domain-containing protein n=1 Tax=Mucilaginibacter sp. TaxID=1882438 RepID=UPI0025F41801|nr:DUF3347 domain-containing protein [Mucilaginibacter sp.]